MWEESPEPSLATTERVAVPIAPSMDHENLQTVVVGLMRAADQTVPVAIYPASAHLFNFIKPPLGSASYEDYHIR